MYFKNNKPVGALDEFLEKTIRLKIDDDVVKIDVIGRLTQEKKDVHIDRYRLLRNDMDIEIEFLVDKARVIYEIKDNVGKSAYPTIEVTPIYIS